MWRIELSFAVEVVQHDRLANWLGAAGNPQVVGKAKRR